MAYRIDAENVILGNGDLIKNGSIVFEQNKITYVGENEHAPKTDKITSTNTVIPGLWDVHVHFSGIKTPSMETTLTNHPMTAALRCVWDANELLMSGFTSTRDVGGVGIFLNRAIQEGAITGPRIYGANKVISTTGGHGDVHNLDLDTMHHLSSQPNSLLGELADGVDGCYRAVRKQLRVGADAIKFCASGGVMSEIDHPIHQQFSLEEQKAIVDEAARAEVSVAAHCHGAPGIKSALLAGVKSIEHGSYLDDELADLMIEKDAILVPTRYVVEKLYRGAEASGAPEYAMNKLRGIYDVHKNAIQIAIRKGVTIATGTDMFTSGPNSLFRFGENAFELELLVSLGMKPMDVIKAATYHGPMVLGKRAPKSGMLASGYDADLVLLNSNPLDDIKILQDRSKIINVVKQGNFVN